MSYSAKLKERATTLRKKGYSLKEISEKLQIAKSTTSVWLTDITISSTAQKRLARKQILGQYKTVLLKRRLKEAQREENHKRALKMLQRLPLSKELIKLCCSLIWWCEGNKETKSVRFTSSDITLIKNFLFFLRSGFDLDESKFRALIHIHAYHNDTVQKQFWSNVTKIPLTQFHKSYKKSNTGIRTKQNYPGCIAITYYDAKVAKELAAIYNAFTSLRGVR